ncbi:MAG TPA: methionyl-tRNA formyltransferase [Acidobacteriaceae bacterium]|nr:methionyl-tRNA formyltransferase [Acidobacteriaceae bacterium]
MRLVFCGTPAFAVPVLEILLASGHTVELVISQPDRPSGRKLEMQPGAVKQIAQRRGLAIAQPEKIRTNLALQQQLGAIAPDAIVVVAYGRLIPPWMLELPRHGNLNLHASLLPKYRGAAPIQWAIANGEQETGVTTMRIDQGLDTGDILLQQSVPILPDQTAPEIAANLATIGAKLMLDTLQGLEAGTLQPRPQEDNFATFAPILRREDGRIDFTLTADRIYSRWRAFQPWPGAFCYLRGKKLTVHAMQVSQSASHCANPLPGTILRNDDQLFVNSGAGTSIRILELQVEGKRRMDVSTFLNGFSFLPGERLE